MKYVRNVLGQCYEAFVFQAAEFLTSEQNGIEDLYELSSILEVPPHLNAGTYGNAAGGELL